VLPTTNPIKLSNFNYTIVAVGVVALGAWLWWIVSARKWFTGPRHLVRPSTPAASQAAARPQASQESPVQG
jgi:hypothetical protein